MNTRILQYKEETSIAWLEFGDSPHGIYHNPAGIQTLVAYLQKHYENKELQQVTWFNDNNVATYTLLEQYIRNSAPQYICLSVKIGYLEDAIKILSLLKDNGLLEETKIILGGREFLTDIQKIKLTLNLFPKAIIVSGYGEESLYRILLEEPIDTIPNLFYLDENAQVKQTVRQLPDTEKYVSPTVTIKTLNSALSGRRISYIESSIGCSHAEKTPCSFCANSSSIQDISWHQFNIDEVMKNIIYQAKYHKHINLTAEDLLGGFRGDEFIEKLYESKKNGLIPADTTFSGSVRVNDIYSIKDSVTVRAYKIKRIALMKAVGFTTLFCGVESGCPQQLARYMKGSTVEDNRQALKILKNLNINFDGGFIFFDPLLSDLDEILQNISFIKAVNNPRLFSKMKFLRVYPGTTYEKMYLAKGSRIKPKVKIFLEIIKKAFETVPYLTLLETPIIYKFHEYWRNLMFMNNNLIELKQCECIAIEMGTQYLDFLEKLVTILNNNSPNSKEEIVELQEKYFNTIFPDEVKKLELFMGSR